MRRIITYSASSLLRLIVSTSVLLVKLVYSLYHISFYAIQNQTEVLNIDKGTNSNYLHEVDGPGNAGHYGFSEK